MNNPATSQICFKSDDSDSSAFGQAIAANEKYIVVGDPKANHVVVYEKQGSGDWSRVREILPPTDSMTAQVGSGFGYDLALHHNSLIIGAYTEKHKPESQAGFQWTNQLGVAFSGGVYQVSLVNRSNIRRIDTVAAGEITGFSVAADDNLIAFGTKQEVESGIWHGKVEILGGETSQITPPTASAAQSFAIDIDLKNHLLLVGAPFDETGAAWLFNLRSPADAPQRLARPDTHVGSTVALSEKFAIASARVSGTYASTAPQTLIFDLQTNTLQVLAGFGEVAIAQDWFVRTHHGSPDGALPAQLDLFDLSGEEKPDLVNRQQGYVKAHVYQDLLITVQNQTSGPQLCIQQGFI